MSSEQALECGRKARRTPNQLGCLPVYIFEPSIFDALERTPPGKGDEIQLTDGFVKLIEEGKNVNAVKLGPDGIRWDVGTSENLLGSVKSFIPVCGKKIIFNQNE